MDAAIDAGWTVAGHNEDYRDECPDCRKRSKISHEPYCEEPCRCEALRDLRTAHSKVTVEVDPNVDIDAAAIRVKEDKSTCGYCGEAEGHSERCAVVRLGYWEVRVSEDGTARVVMPKSDEVTCEPDERICRLASCGHDLRSHKTLGCEECDPANRCYIFVAASRSGEAKPRGARIVRAGGFNIADLALLGTPREEIVFFGSNNSSDVCDALTEESERLGIYTSDAQCASCKPGHPCDEHTYSPEGIAEVEAAYGGRLPYKPNAPSEKRPNEAPHTCRAPIDISEIVLGSVWECDACHAQWALVKVVDGHRVWVEREQRPQAKSENEIREDERARWSKEFRRQEAALLEWIAKGAALKNDDLRAVLLDEVATMLETNRPALPNREPARNFDE